MDASLWARWGAARPPSDVLHLDTAAAGRSSLATLEAVAAHARVEAEVGGYVAEQQAADQLETTRADAATALASDPAGVAFVESGTAALERLLSSWPLREGARVGVVPAEWGTNLDLLRHRGLRTVSLPVDGNGVVDLEALAAQLRDDPPDLLLLDHVAAHRGLVQPAAEVIGAAQAAGVPLWLDAAQSVGHVRVPAGADAVLATSRKWLTGPRGVGLLAVAPQHRAALQVAPLGKKPDASPLQRLEPDEAHVAGRVGLGVALRELLALGVPEVSARLVEVGRLVRDAVADLPGWEVALPDAPAGAITGLVPTAGQDVVATQARLTAEHRILTTAGLGWRAPGESAGTSGWLRISPHVDLDDQGLDRLVRALHGFGAG